MRQENNDNFKQIINGFFGFNNSQYKMKTRQLEKVLFIIFHPSITE